MQALFDLPRTLQLLDVGAACITEKPIYLPLLENNKAHLNAFEGDARQVEKIQTTFGDRATVYDQFLFDGSERTVYIATPGSGMTSLLRPDPAALAYFNGFEQFGAVHNTQTVQTRRLDDIADCPNLDFVKMDVQGAELTVLENGREKIADAVAIQLEVSYVPLYLDQPGFGAVDLWLRDQGFMPHRFLDIKRWSIAPTVLNRNIRNGMQQLLESDIVYIKNPLAPGDWQATQLRALINIAHFCLGSPDLVVHLARELVRRGEAEEQDIVSFLGAINAAMGEKQQLALVR